MTTFQLIVDNRVAKTVNSLQEALGEAAMYLQHSKKPKIEIVNLSGGIYCNEQVLELLEN